MTVRDDKQGGAHLPTGSLVSTALSLVLLTAACGGDGDDPPQTQPTASQTASSIPTKTLSPQEQREEDAKAEAEATIVRYFKVTDQVGHDPTVSLSRLKSVAISTNLGLLENRYRGYRAEDHRSTGSTRVVTQNVDDVNLDNSNPKKGVVPYVVLTVCIDVSKLDVIDGQGNSVVANDRPDQRTTRYTVANYSWSESPRRGWRVASAEDIEEGPCEG
jgi:hypothetical protein